MDRGAGLLILNPETGQILMTRRSQDSTYPGYWDFPGGGVEQGENQFDAAIREAVEELGSLPRLRIKTNPVWWLPSADFSFASFLAQLEPSRQAWEPVLNPEHDEWGWFYPDDLPEQTIPGAIHAINEFFGTGRGT